MRDPSNLNSIYEKDKVNIIKIDELPEYDIRDCDLNNPKEFKRYIDRIEKRIVRNSFEYKEMVKYLKEFINMNKCSFYKNVSNQYSDRIKIHIHHDPITLYDLCIIVFNKRRALNESLTDELVGKEVMYLHYRLMVGLIPLAETVHELVHKQYLFIPTTHVMGNYKAFIEEYYEFFNPEQIEILKRIEDFTEKYNNLRMFNKELLNESLTYIDITGVYDLPPLHEVIEIMSNRIDEFKNRA